MAVKIRKTTAIAALSITPLIDVVFLLLIFFLVATRFAAEDRELDVLLPSASTAMPMTVAPKEMFINIDRQGKFFVQGETMAADEVEKAIERAVADNPVSQSVIIRADRRVPLEPVVTVMDLCNKAGVFDYTLTIEGQ